MKHSFSFSVFLTLCSLVTVSSESQAQNVPPNIRQRIDEIITVNPVITREIQTPIRRCKNQFARKKIIEDYVKALTPNITKLVSDKAAAEAALVLTARDLATAQNAASAIAATLETIEAKLRMLNLSAAERIAAIESKIAQAVAEKEVASDLLEQEDDSWDIWKSTGTNDDDLDAAANRQFNNQPLTARDREVLGALTRHQAALDTLNARVLQAENNVASFLRARQDAQAGIQQEEAALRRLREEKIAEKRVADEKVRRCQQARNHKEAEVRSLAARISSLTAVKAPPIHWACYKLVASR